MIKCKITNDKQEIIQAINEVFKFMPMEVLDVLQNTFPMSILIEQKSVITGEVLLVYKHWKNRQCMNGFDVETFSFGKEILKKKEWVKPSIREIEIPNE